MANDLLRLAWKAPIKKGPKMVLIALADSANKDGECWPSRASLADKAECAESTVSRHIQTLVTLGVVEQVRRRRKAAVYRVLADVLVKLQDVSVQDISNQDVLNQDVSLTTSKMSQTETFLKGTLIEPSIESRSPKTSNRAYDTDFEQWWARYPKRDGSRGSKFVASKAWTKALRVTTPETLAAALSTYLASKRVQDGFAKDAATWLNQRCWEDESGAESATDVTAWLKAEWQAGRVRDIEDRAGLRYRQPDLPAHLSDKADIEQWMREQARAWIAANRELITERLASRRTA